MSTYLGIPHPSALLLQLKWASLGAKSTQNGKQSVFREFDVFGFPGAEFGHFPIDFAEFVGTMLGILTEHVAMVLIKVLPNRI